MSLVAVAAGVAVLSGAALQSAVGFGFALVCAPLLYAALSPEEAIGLMVVLALEVNLLTLLGERRRPVAVVARRARRRRPGRCPGALAGVAILRSLDDVALQLLVTAGVLASLPRDRGQTSRPPGPGGQALRPAAPGDPPIRRCARFARAGGRAPALGPRALAGSPAGR